MRWLSDLVRGPDLADLAPAPSQVSSDSWEGLARASVDVEDQANAAADTLPPTAVVLARRILDGIDAVLAPGDASLPAEARISVHAILTDYLPTTLRTYLAAVRHAEGPTPAADTHLREQLDFIRGALDSTRDALRQNDMRAVETQAQFLRTKYTESDLV